MACLVVFSACGPSARSEARRAAEAAREAELAAAARTRSERLEVERLAALWTYHDIPVENGQQRTAAIRSTENVDSGGQEARSVQLVFRDHPSWGRSSYVVLQSGDFACTPRCTVTVTADDREPIRMAARRPNTDEAIAMFINDAQALWKTTTVATRLNIEFPVKAGGTRAAGFEVAGLDDSKMPGWN
jgi:hypothetical protein